MDKAYICTYLNLALNSKMNFCNYMIHHLCTFELKICLSNEQNCYMFILCKKEVIRIVRKYSIKSIGEEGSYQLFGNVIMIIFFDKY